VTQEQAEKVIFGARNADLAFALLSENATVRDNPGVTASDIMPEAFLHVPGGGR
jgi:pilus assembly protein CpaB